MTPSRTAGESIGSTPCATSSCGREPAALRDEVALLPGPLAPGRCALLPGPLAPGRCALLPAPWLPGRPIATRALGLSAKLR